MKLKFCGLTRKQDILAANAARPDYVGFVFADSRRRVTEEQAARLRAQLAPGIQAVGVFVNDEPERIAALVNAGVIDLVQLHGGENRAYLDRLRGKMCIRDRHNMLVDLGRNDLGRVSRIGSVEVTAYQMIHRYSKIMHICSQVEGDLADGCDALDALEAVLPAGTLSGAPKIRACEIIEELERAPRGVYGGALGYLDLAGNMDTCIAIRMAAKKEGMVTVQAGGGIVADSVPHNEYMESANKARAVMSAIERASEVDG